ncbi:methylenetetrahydrofolate reductase (NADPH) [Osmia lignaria lignaria]|uniref:methylenetetrahydrofolate reductase (NADPH) n=1 Tax=Osmia lignaria lignaria TaxID=1437193 RepID=UPI00402B0EC6
MRKKCIVVKRAFCSYMMRKSNLKNGIHQKFANNNESNNVANYFGLRNTGHEAIDLRKKLKSLIDTNTVFCSFELLSLKNDDFYQSFFTEMNKYHPLFYALTSHTKNKTKHYEFLKLTDTFPNNVLLHLIANNLTRTDAKSILEEALKCGIRNVFALRGDSITASSDFPHAVDLVRFIKSQFGDTFCICVAGYPEIHPESPSKELDLFYLKEKVNAGADFIITQIFFEANIFIKFANDCKEVGINVPIIPGIYPIHNYSCLEKIANVCNIKIPQNILDSLQSIKDDDNKVRNYGIGLSTNIIEDIIASGTTCGFHLFTLNRTSLISEICNELDIFH